VKIADFGLAKLVGRGPTDVTLTADHQALGTLHYMAPEQMLRPQEVDHRADIYSLGVTLYEMLTGELPLGRFAPPSQKVQVDVRLDEVVLKALEREPERRYQHASDVKSDVESIASSPALPAKSAVPAFAKDPDLLESARRQVRGPAIGLIATGVLNWVLLVGGATVVAIFAAVNETFRARFEPEPMILALAIGMLLLSGFTMFAGFQMLHLQSRRICIAGSVLAMFVSPGNLIGLPIGIWSLVVLFRRDVRAAFERTRSA
jgi:hypothetical protein